MDIFDCDLVISTIKIAIFVPPGSENRFHTNRSSHGFAFNIDRTVTYLFDSGKALTCHPGQCIYLPKASNYTIKKSNLSALSPNAGVYAINFLLLDDDQDYEPFVLNIRGKDKVRSCFTRAEAAWRQKPTGFREECFSALYQLIRIFKKELVGYSHLNSVLTKIAPALDYIEANYTSESISLPHLAQLCGMSEPHLRKLFNSAFSVPPSVYIRNMRLNYAKELLRTGEYSVTSVALMAGFNNATYFAREFKKVTGVSPNKYGP